MRDLISYLLLVKIINDNTNEQIQTEEWSTHDKNDKIYITPHGSFVFGLTIFAAYINRIVHDFKPSHKSGDLKQGKVTIPNIVEINVRHFPINDTSPIFNKKLITN